MSERQIDTTNPRVLIVDDTPANLKLLRDTLEAEGYRVLPVPIRLTAHSPFGTDPCSCWADRGAQPRSLAQGLGDRLT